MNIMVTGATGCYSKDEQPKIKKLRYYSKDYNFSDKIYISISNSDEFQGLIIPKEFEKIIKIIVNHDKYFDIIGAVFDNYKEFRDYEVECSHQARHGSCGSDELYTLDEILEYFIEYDDKKLNNKLKKFIENKITND